MFEKKNGKRFLASVMALVMLLSLAPVGALAADDETPNEENTAVTHEGNSRWPTQGGAEQDGNVNITKGTTQNCTAYYVQSTDSTLTEFEDALTTTYTAPYGVIFFVKPDDGYALTSITSNEGAIARFFSIADADEIADTAFYTSDQVQKLKAGGFTDNQIAEVVQEARDQGCVAAFIYTKAAGTSGDLTTKLNFYAEPLATLKKDITQVTSGEKTYTGEELKNIKVQEGDVITYSFEVDYKNSSVTYRDVTVTDDRLDDADKTMTFSGKAGEIQEADYTVKTEDISGDKLSNTAELSYTYTATFDTGTHTATATATKEIAAVGVVSYQYESGSPANAPELPVSKSYREGATVTVEEEPALTGYVFNGWNTDDVGVNDGTFTMPNHSVTFTGSWTAKNDVSYMVHYYKDGTTEKVSEDKIVNGQTFNTRVTEEAPTVTGYTVVGESTKTMTLDAYGKEITFYYTQDEPTTDTVDAKYFILTPSMTAPTDGSSQGVGNYFPNSSDCGGVEGKDTDSGYPGKIKSSLLTDHPKADTQSGYADTTNGIDGKYLEAPADMGYFSEKNYTNGEYIGYNKDKFPKVLKNLVDENQNFDMNNYEIVWYVVKKESNGYHVDGYLKGVSIELKYFDTFGGTTTEITSATKSLKSGDKVTIENKDIIAADRTGWTFEGWTTNADGTGKLYKAGDEETLITSTSLYAKWTNTYTVVTHFKDADGIEQEELKQTKDKLTATSGKLLKDLVVKPDLTNIQGTYVHVPSETSYSVNGQDKGTVGNATYTEANTVIHQYYYLDETGKTGKDDENNPTDESDEIPDAWQYKVTFKVVNGKWNSYDNSDDIVVYVNAKDKNGNTLDPKLTATQIPTAGEKPDSSYTASGKWDSEPNTTTPIERDTVYTFTYEKEKEPVVEPIQYTIKQHFIDAKKVDTTKSTTTQATEEKTFENSIPEEMLQVKQDFGNPKQNYVYVPTETTYKVGDQKKEATDNLANGAVIDLYYYLDVIGGKDEKGNPIDKGDEIPDCYQVTIIYKSSDESRGKISDASLKKEVLTIEDEEGNRLISGKVEITGASAEATGSRCYFSSWTNDANVDTSKAGATLEKQKFTAKGGETYTFTANFGKRSSSGGNSRPSTPTIDIPDDDVPTGLNGADHYAYIIGYGNNDVRPQQSITRAEVATIFFRLLTDETREANMTKNQNYSDVKDSDWYCRAVATLSSMGIIKGYNDGTFQPNAPITRAEFAAIAARFDPDGDTTPATFSDVGSHWAKDEISIAANHGWINGYEDGTFKPDRNITRAEAVTLINRVLKRLPETKEDLHEDMKTWVDNMDETAWYYLAIQEATNGHYNKNKEGTKYETWTDLRENRDWSELEK